MKRFAMVAVGLLVVVGIVCGTGMAQEDPKHKGDHPEGRPDHPKKPDCGHDFKAIHEKMKMTEDQRAKMDEIRKKINEETKGNNKCVLHSIMEEIKKAKDDDAAKDLKAQAEKMKETIKAAMEKFEKEREAILTDEQKKVAEEMKALMKEHREKCMPPKPEKGEGRPEKGEGRPEKHPPMKEGHHKCDADEAKNDGVFHHHPDKIPGKDHDKESKS